MITWCGASALPCQSAPAGTGKVSRAFWDGFAELGLAAALAAATEGFECENGNVLLVLALGEWMEVLVCASTGVFLLLGLHRTGGTSQHLLRERAWGSQPSPPLQGQSHGVLQGLAA